MRSWYIYYNSRLYSGNSTALYLFHRLTVISHTDRPFKIHYQPLHHFMVSLARGPPACLMPESGSASPTISPAGEAEHRGDATTRDFRNNFLPSQQQQKAGTVAPANTPARPPPVAIAPRMGGGRPIGLALNRAKAGAPHAMTPGNTPSSLETMGRRIVGRLQGDGGNAGGRVGKIGGQDGGNGARIAPSYE